MQELDPLSKGRLVTSARSMWLLLSASDALPIVNIYNNLSQAYLDWRLKTCR